MSDLTDLVDRIESLLKDASNDVWETTELDEALRLALSELSGLVPARAVTTLDAVDDTWEYDISGIAGLIAVVEVWYPYLSTDATYKRPHPAKWRMLDDDTLLLEYEGGDPDAAYDLRIFYDKMQTITGLDSATATSVNEHENVALVVGAAGYAAQAKARSTLGQVNVGARTPEWYSAWSRARLKQFWAKVYELAAREDASEDSRIGWWQADKWDV